MLKWLAQVEKKTFYWLPRAPMPVLGGISELFVGSVAPMVDGMQGIQNENTLTKVLNELGQDRAHPCRGLGGAKTEHIYCIYAFNT
mmetsp:Transcript_17676/g.29487  ORF Transcript_17676/g.29487 Transcript_17676/m.29487 type:complete len:86 (-) Transcript_17676:87-344(-)